MRAQLWLTILVLCLVVNSVPGTPADGRGANVFSVGSIRAMLSASISDSAQGGVGHAETIGLTWNTFLGGSGSEEAGDIAIDSSGNVYVTGYSDVGWGSPVRVYSGGGDCYVVKLDSNGELIWNTFLGGSGVDYGSGVALDGDGNVYVSGGSYLTWGSPVVTYTAGLDAFVAKLDNHGGLIWNTFLGGSGNDSSDGISNAGGDHMVVVGESNATWGTPIRTYTSAVDTFVAMLDMSGGRTWHTFLGGDGVEYGLDIAMGNQGIVVAGRSTATWGLPVRAYSGGGDMFAAKLDSSGVLTWNTFLGGSGQDMGWSIAVDGIGNVVVTGTSDETWGSPVRAYAGSRDAVAARLDSSGGLTWNTFLGGIGNDTGYGITLDGSGNVYVTGSSSATWGSPARPYTAGSDAFVTKLGSSGGLVWNTFFGGSGGDNGWSIVVDDVPNIYVTGESNATWGSPVRAYSGGWDMFAAKLTLYEIYLFLPLVMR